MNQATVQDFVNRNWARLSALDRTYWATEYQRNGSRAAQRASQILWQHMKSIRPEWPEPAERERDLENHIAWKQLLDRIANDLPSR